MTLLFKILMNLPTVISLLWQVIKVWHQIEGHPADSAEALKSHVQTLGK